VHAKWRGKRKNITKLQLMRMRLNKVGKNNPAIMVMSILAGLISV
jgi:hypothetical protein